MGKIVEPTIVFRTPSAEKVDAAQTLLERAGFPTVLQSALEADVLIDAEEDEEVREGFSHTLWTAAARSEAAAERLRAAGFAGRVEPPEPTRRKWTHPFARFLFGVVVVSVAVWILSIVKELLK